MLRHASAAAAVATRRAPNGAADGAMLESWPPKILMNAGSPADWEVMIDAQDDHWTLVAAPWAKSNNEGQHTAFEYAMAFMTSMLLNATARAAAVDRNA